LGKTFAALSRATCIHSKQFFTRLSTAFFLTSDSPASTFFSPEKRAAGRPVFRDCQALSRTHIILAAAFLMEAAGRPGLKPAALSAAQAIPFPKPQKY
jgi:hypothetical protein